MPRLTKSLPKYRIHKATKQALVRLEGRDHYLGPHGSKASKVEYNRLIDLWLARGRPDTPQATVDEITIIELIAAYLEFAKVYYRKNGKVTKEIQSIAQAMRF